MREGAPADATAQHVELSIDNLASGMLGRAPTGLDGRD